MIPHFNRRVIPATLATPMVTGKYLPHAPPSTLIMGVQLAELEMLIEIER